MKDTEKIELHMDKVRECLVEFNRAVLESAKRKLESGAVDLEQHNVEESRLAKMVLASSLRDHCEDFDNPYSDEFKREVKNLSHF